MKAVYFVVGIVGLALGGGLGYLATTTFQEPQEVITETQTVQAELTDEDLQKLCSGLTEAEKRNVLEVQSEVQNLQEQIADREAELERLKASMEKDKANQEVARKKGKRWKRKLNLQIQLAVVEQERDDLKVELQETLVELKKQVKQTQKFKAKAKKYKAQSTKNLWSAFQAQAKVKGCDRGSRKRHEKCHEAFDAGMTTKAQQRFFNCVDTYQAVPVLKKLDRGEFPASSFRIFEHRESFYR